MATKANAFDVGDYVVYPKHGVGRVIELQEQEIAGMKLELYVLRFEKERMTLRVPTNKVEAIGMRKLSSDKTLREALDTLKGKPKVKRTMWSRRAQEYEAKINSGDLVSIAEVTRDLFRADDQPEQSYSERQIFEAASSRLARELAAMEKTEEPAALTSTRPSITIRPPAPERTSGQGMKGPSCGAALFSCARGIPGLVPDAANRCTGSWPRHAFAVRMGSDAYLRSRPCRGNHASRAVGLYRQHRP